MNTSIRREILLAVCMLIFTGALRADVPELLHEALKKEREQQLRWAFTETQEVRDGKGKVHDTAVLRYDPSRPFAEQYQPISVDGKAPPKKVIQECRERGEQEAREREKKSNEAQDDDAPEIELGSEKGIAEFSQARVSEENEQFITYKIPVHARKKSKFPFEQIVILIRVDKAERALAGIRLVLTAPVRINLVAKLRSADFSCSFSKQDNAYPPLMTAAEIQANLSFLFSKSNQRVSIKRTDFKRVKPYDDRFTVKAGPLRAIGF